MCSSSTRHAHPCSASLPLWLRRLRWLLSLLHGSHPSPSTVRAQPAAPPDSLPLDLSLPLSLACCSMTPSRLFTLPPTPTHHPASACIRDRRRSTSRRLQLASSSLHLLGHEVPPATTRTCGTPWPAAREIQPLLRASRPASITACMRGIATRGQNSILKRPSAQPSCGVPVPGPDSD